MKDVWLLPGFLPSAPLVARCHRTMCLWWAWGWQQSQQSQQSQQRQRQQQREAGTTLSLAQCVQTSCVTLHHYHHTSLVRTPTRKRHWKWWESSLRSKMEKKIGLDFFLEYDSVTTVKVTDDSQWCVQLNEQSKVETNCQFVLREKSSLVAFS